MTNTGNEYSSEFDALTDAGVQVSTYTGETPIYIHAKAILVDDGESDAKVFLGSENFSSASLTKNRELGMITNNAAVLSSVSTTLTSDFKGASPWS
jgi:phosphatidylserine/phosphatidylglycerophosphate/cardiolipin synthase-like enzyme